jgi:hypothetical protein
MSGDSPVLPPEPGDCCECRGCVPTSEPQVVLTYNPNAGRLYFHAQCAMRAYVEVASRRRRDRGARFWQIFPCET